MLLFNLTKNDFAKLEKKIIILSQNTSYYQSIRAVSLYTGPGGPWGRRLTPVSIA